MSFRQPGGGGKFANNLRGHQDLTEKAGQQVNVIDLAERNEGPVLQTTGPDLPGSGIVHFLLKLRAAQIGSRDSHASQLQQKINAVHSAHSRRLARGQFAKLKKLDGQEKLARARQLLQRLAGVQQQRIRQLQLNGLHCPSSCARRSKYARTTLPLVNRGKRLKAAEIHFSFPDFTFNFSPWFS
jgi:hypothetical protein